MYRTANLNLPFLLQNQLNKEAVINEALFIVDCLSNPSAESLQEFSELPADLNEGDVVLTSNSEVAFYKNGWYKIKLKPGFRLWVKRERIAYIFDGAEWKKEAAGSADEGGMIEALTQRIAALEERFKQGKYGDVMAHDGSEFANSASISGVSALGVNTTADSANNRLSVVGNSNLFASETGDVRLNLNKKALGNTASFVFQANWSGRAEFGLTGGDDFALKVSADGVKWMEVFKINRTTGVLDFKADVTKNGVKIF